MITGTRSIIHTTAAPHLKYKESARPPAKTARPSCFCTNTCLLCPGKMPRKQSFTCLFCSPPHSKVQPTGTGTQCSPGKGNISPPRPSISALLFAHSKKILHYLPWFFSPQLKTKFTTFIQSGYSHIQGIIQTLFFSIQGAEGKPFIFPFSCPQHPSHRTPQTGHGIPAETSRTGKFCPVFVIHVQE